MKQIGLYNPQHTSSLIYLNEGDDLTKWLEIGFKPFHENNKDYLFIDWTPLVDWINATLGVDVEIYVDLSGKRPQILCPNLVGDSGIFSAVVREVSVGFFNFDGNADNFWGTISLFYQSWNSGSNGMKVGDVWYNCTTKEWTFETSKDRTLRFESGVL